MTKVIAIICARGGSKGLEEKNIRHLDGEPLIARVVRHAKESSQVDRIFVSTDSQKIADEAVKAGAEVPFLRPEEYAQDLTTTEATLQQALISFEEYAEETFDIGVFITATDIFRKSEWIDEAVSKLKENPDLESVFVGTKTHKNYWELNENGEWERLKPWMAVYGSRQVRRFIVREDTGLACASRTSLWRERKRIGDKVDIIVNDDDFSFIDIHTSEDLALAEAAISIRKEIDEG